MLAKKIVVKYTKADLNKIASQKVLVKLPIMVFAILLGMTISYFVMRDVFSSLMGNIIIAGIILMILIVGILLSKKMVLNRLQKQFKVGQSKEYEIKSRTINWDGESKNIISVIETKNYLLLNTSSFLFHALPKEKFTPEEIKLLKNKK